MFGKINGKIEIIVYEQTNRPPIKILTIPKRR